MSLKLILGSTSPYRKTLMERLGFPFTALKPLYDEEIGKQQFYAQNPASTTAGGPGQLALYLAHHKAKSLATADRIVVGGDQLVAFENRILGKPGTREKAIEQLLSLQGKEHELITAVSVHTPDLVEEFIHRTRIRMRQLDRTEIASVVDRDQSWDAAGAYKIEGAGITLMEELECSDPSAIEGLPLIELGRILRRYMSTRKL